MNTCKNLKENFHMEEHFLDHFAVKGVNLNMKKNTLNDSWFVKEYFNL